MLQSLGKPRLSLLMKLNFLRMQHPVKNYAQENNSILSVTATPRHGALERMYQIAEMATPLHQQVWFNELADTEEHLQREATIGMLYYRGLLFKFKKYCQEPEHRYFGKRELLDLADTLSDLTIYLLNEEVKNEIQWLITELYQMAETATAFQFAFSEDFLEDLETYSYEEFIKFCDKINPRAFRISTAKKGEEVRIMLSVHKRKAYFGNGQTFQEAFKKLILDMYQ